MLEDEIKKKTKKKKQRKLTPANMLNLLPGT
jgi:hypothetical protein